MTPHNKGGDPTLVANHEKKKINENRSGLFIKRPPAVLFPSVWAHPWNHHLSCNVTELRAKNSRETVVRVQHPYLLVVLWIFVETDIFKLPVHRCCLYNLTLNMQSSWKLDVETCSRYRGELELCACGEQIHPVKESLLKIMWLILVNQPALINHFFNSPQCLVESLLIF